MRFVCNNKMHIQSCMFNFLSELESYIEFDGFSGEEGFLGEEKLFRKLLRMNSIFET